MTQNCSCGKNCITTKENMAGKIAELNPVAHGYVPFIRLNFTGNHPEQGGFAAAVGSDDGDPLPPENGKVHIPIQAFVIKSL